MSKIFVIANYDECFSVMNNDYINFKIAFINIFRELMNLSNIKDTNFEQLHKIELNNRRLLKKLFKQLK